MPNKKENQVVNEEENLENSKKIDLYINNNDDEEQGISIMNIFTLMGKRFKIYAWLMVATLLLGLLVPTIMYELKDKKDSAVAVLGLDYEKADQGKAPDGTDLDISYLKSSYIVQNALNNVNLTKNVSAAQVQSNLKITGILTEETRQQLDIINKLEEIKNADYSKMLKEFEFKYRAQYIISLDSIFKEGNNKVVLPTSDTSKLLNAITDAYNEYFVDTYQAKDLPSNYLAAININSLDYLDILDEVSASYEYLSEYCLEKAKLIPSFRVSQGQSFTDLAGIIKTLKDTEIDDYYSYIYLNHVSKNKDMTLTNYKVKKREAEYKLAEIEDNIAVTKSSIANYKPDKKTINSTTDGGAPITVDVYPEAYYDLIFSLKELNEEKSELERKISIYTDRIAVLEGSDPTAEQLANAEKFVAKALENANNTFNLVNDFSLELFASNAYKSRYMHTVTTSESEGLKDNLKQFLIGAGVGLAIGLVIWVADAFILEFKAVRKVNELKEDK